MVNCNLHCGGSPTTRYFYGKGIGSKIGVVRPGTCEVNDAVLRAKAVWADGHLSVAHFTTCTTVHNGGGRHLRMGVGGELFV